LAVGDAPAGDVAADAFDGDVDTVLAAPELVAELVLVLAVSLDAGAFADGVAAVPVLAVDGELVAPVFPAAAELVGVLVPVMPNARRPVTST
jgi:hypothetical protein